MTMKSQLQFHLPLLPAPLAAYWGSLQDLSSQMRVGQPPTKSNTTSYGTAQSTRCCASQFCFSLEIIRKIFLLIKPKGFLGNRNNTRFGQIQNYYRQIKTLSGLSLILPSFMGYTPAWAPQSTTSSSPSTTPLSTLQSSVPFAFSPGSLHPSSFRSGQINPVTRLFVSCSS